MPQLLKRQHTPEWHVERNKRLTCSDVAAALGLCSYKTTKKLWQEKTGLCAPFAGNVATAWGNDKESTALADFEAVTGRLIIPGGFWVHPSIAWLGASPDGLLGDYELVQTKAPFNRVLPDEPPVHYVVQCIAELEVTQREVNHLHYWTPAGSRTFRIERSREKWADWYPQLERFWNQVESKAWASNTKSPPTAASTPTRTPGKKRPATSVAAS
jgi:putative phage-type endonuclease